MTRDVYGSVRMLDSVAIENGEHLRFHLRLGQKVRKAQANEAALRTAPITTSLNNATPPSPPRLP